MILDLSQISLTQSGPRGASLAEKQVAIASWLAEVLALHATATDGRAWTVATYADPRLLRTAAGRSDRVAVMGDPARYAEAIWTGYTPYPDGGSYDPTAPAVAFEIGLYFGTGISLTSPTLAADVAAAHAAFRSVADNASDTVPGVLYAAVRQEEIVTASGEVVAFSPPSSVTAGRLPGPAGAADDTLALTFTVTLS